MTSESTVVRLRHGRRSKPWWVDEINKLKAKIHRTKQMKAPAHDPDALLRRLYSECELLRMDYVAQDYVSAIVHPPHSHPAAKVVAAQHGSSAAAAPSPAADGKDAEEVKDILELFDELRSSLAMKVTVTKSPTTYLRVGLSLVYFLGWVPILFVCSPLRLLHPLLRLIGLRNNYLPVDVLQKIMIRGYLQLNGVYVFLEGGEHLDKYHNTLCMYSHSSNLDPPVVASGPIFYKFVGKKILFRVPIFGWLLSLLGHIGIDRSNRKKAIDSLHFAAQEVHKWGRSVSIAPEGTRSKTGRLIDFKKGPFHVAAATQLDITPVVLINNFNLWPPGQAAPSSGHVTMRIGPRVPVKESDDYRSLAERVRRVMLETAAKPMDSPSKRRPLCSPARLWLARLFLPGVYLCMWLLWRKWKATLA